MDQQPLPTRALRRKNAARAALGLSNSAFYDQMSRGLVTTGIKIGPRAVAWPDTEIEAIVSARVAGWNDDQIRALVRRLIAGRSLTAENVIASILGGAPNDRVPSVGENETGAQGPSNAVIASGSRSLQRGRAHKQ